MEKFFQTFSWKNKEVKLDMQRLIDLYVGNKANGECQNGGNKKTKHAKQGVRNVRFFGKFGVLCFLVTSVLKSALLPYYWRI